jgi:hypothetical protein
MKKRIKDEFSDLPISRQRRYVLRMLRDKRCAECGEPAERGSRCLKHLIQARERQRKARGLQRRYYGTLSYRLQAQANIVSLEQPVVDNTAQPPSETLSVQKA